MKTQAEVIDGVVEAVSGFGGILRCNHCGAERPLGDIGAKFSAGWPTCCYGHTMTWITQNQLDAALTR